MRYAHPHHHHCGPAEGGVAELREALYMGGRGRGRGRGPGRGGPRGYGGRGGFGGPRRHRARRGQIREAILVLLGEEPRNGYALIQEIEQRSDGAWRPSPGSIYPALSLLEDEGLIRSTGGEDQRAYELTDTGREALAARGEDASDPWEEASRAVGDETIDARHLLGHVGMALRQVVEVGSQEQIAQAVAVLGETRRSLYAILADDPADREAGDSEDANDTEGGDAA